MSQALRHLQPEPTQSSVSTTRSRRGGKTLLAVALALPTSAAGLGLAGPASAAGPTPQAAPQPAAKAAAPAATPTPASSVAAGLSVTTGHWAGGVYVVKYGDTGKYVKTLQGRLKISQDGSFGPKTRASVKAFQAKKGLAKDGVVGPNTWRALGGFPGGSSGGGGGNGGGSSTSSSKAVQIAAKYIGTPYVYGGSTPSGFDCSGLTSHVFKQLGKSLPRSARAQQAAVTRVSSPQPGDLVFYGYPAHHVGIYAGNGQMIDSPKPGMTVQKRAVYQPQVSGYGRI